MVLIFNAVGGGKLPFQLIRLIIQLVLITIAIGDKAKTILFLLVAYHIFSCVSNLYAISTNGLFGVILGSYHLLIGLVIYFHEYVDSLIGKDSVQYPKNEN
jgi:hypothetical protein